MASAVKALGGAKTGGKIGAAVGSLIPGLGSAVMGLVGAGVGGIAGALGKSKEKKLEERLAKMGRKLPSQDTMQRIYNQMSGNIGRETFAAGVAAGPNSKQGLAAAKSGQQQARKGTSQAARSAVDGFYAERRTPMRDLAGKLEDERAFERKALFQIPGEASGRISKLGSFLSRGNQKRGDEAIGKMLGETTMDKAVANLKFKDAPIQIDSPETAGKNDPETRVAQMELLKKTPSMLGEVDFDDDELDSWADGLA
jgi:hypothetical protein